MSARREAQSRAYLSPAIFPLLPLALAAGGIPLFVWSALGDEIAMPRLAASFWLTGGTLAALSWAGAWSSAPWRRLALPCALLAAVILTSVIATAVGTDPVRSLLGEYQRYQGLLPLLMYGALMLAAMVATAYAGTPRPLLIGALVGGVLSAAYGAIQWMGLDWVRWAGLPSGQIGGAFAQPEVLGIELVVAAAASTGLLAEARGRARIAVVAGIALMLFVVLLTLSRGAFVGAAAAAVVLAVLHADLLLSWRSRWWYAIPAAIVLAGAVVVLPQGRDTLGRAWHRIGSARNFTDTSISQRTGLWQLSLEMAADHPVFGAGPDGFPQLFAAYRTQDQPGYHTQNIRPESSHDILLDRLVDTGVVGFAALVGLIGACLWMGWRALSRLDGAGRAMMAALLAAVAGYYVAALFYYAEPMTGWMPWLFLGAMAGMAAAAGAADAPPVPAAWRFGGAARAGAAVLGGLLVAGGLVLVAADYSSARALTHFQEGDLAAAADSMDTASRLNPLQPQYLLALGGYQAGAARAGRADQWAKTAATLHRLNTRFAPTAAGLIREAEAQANVAFSTQADKDRVFALLERAVAADPNNAEVRQGVADFYDSVGEAGRAAPHRAWLAQAQAKGDAPAP